MAFRTVKSLLLVVGAAVAGATVVYLLAGGLPKYETEGLAQDAEHSVDADVKLPPSEAVRVNELASPPPVRFGKEAASVVSNVSNKAVAADDALMDEVIGEILEAISEAKKSKDSRRLLELVGKLSALGYGSASKRYGSGGGAASLKRSVLEALALAGPEGAVRAAEFVNDTDVSIARSATQIVFDSLMDISLGDSARAEIVIAAAAEMTDMYNVMRLTQEINARMRNSEAVKTIKAISKSGTPEAQEQLIRVMQSLTGDTSISDVSQLDGWFQEVGDQHDADKRYGGIKIPQSTGK